MFWKNEEKNAFNHTYPILQKSYTFVLFNNSQYASATQTKLQIIFPKF